MASRPLLFLGLDGALSPLGERVALAKIPLLHVPVPDREPLVFDARLPAWLRRLDEAFELVWANKLGDSANELLGGPLGLDPLPVLHFDARSPRSEQLAGSVNLAWIDAYLDGRPGAWIDASITPADVLWGRRRTKAGIPTDLVKTRRARGLKERHVFDLLAWAYLGFGTGPGVIVHRVTIVVDEPDEDDDELETESPAAA